VVPLDVGAAVVRYVLRNVVRRIARKSILLRLRFACCWFRLLLVM
jgi:hypothetical protein